MYRSLCYKHFEMDESVAVPCGWFSLLDEEGQAARILVFDSQVDGINALINDHEKWLADDSVTPGDLREKYFNNKCLILLLIMRMS